MAPLRATAPCFQPLPVSFDIFLDWQGRSSTTGKLVKMDRAFFNPYVQDAVRNGCLTAAPWLRATGLPRDTLGLLSVCQFYQELALEYLERENLMGTLQQECAALRRQWVRRAARPFSPQEWAAQAQQTQLLAEARKWEADTEASILWRYAPAVPVHYEAVLEKEAGWA
ncbi:hypothetical protein WJX84_004637 [Apatococcus fuscideae]|uniref:Uncharacterized protein n=1 Tax=Apatococcus fuscideae TaxID=2026836 RepID=A0AAW1SUY4_9CHLO